MSMGDFQPYLNANISSNSSFPVYTNANDWGHPIDWTAPNNLTTKWDLTSTVVSTVTSTGLGEGYVSGVFASPISSLPLVITIDGEMYRFVKNETGGMTLRPWSEAAIPLQTKPKEEKQFVFMDEDDLFWESEREA